jgi:uncharacterized protein YdbL (DUF1318 family)
MAQDLYSNLPPEIVLQQQGLNRQQEMAKALLAQGAQQNMGPAGQMVSGRYVPNSFFQNLQGPVNQMLGAYLAKQGDTKAAELAKQIREGRSAAEESIINKMTGTPAQATELAGPYAGKVPMPIAVQPGTSPDLPSALREIRTNQYGAGKEYTPTILKQMMPEKPSDQLGYELAQSQGFPGTFIDYKTGLATAGASRNYQNVQNQLPFKEQIQKEAASGLMKNFETLQNVPSALANMDKMVALSKQPIYAGVGGETKLQIAKLFNNNFGTNIAPETVKNTEEFKSAAYMGIMDNLKKTDSNPTMAQQNALKEAIGSLGTDPAAIPRVVNVMRDVLVNKATQHNELVRQTMQRGVEYPYSIEVQLPPSAPTQPGNVRSAADAILNRKPQ